MNKSNQETREKSCSCIYDCHRRGKCCECLEYHLSMKQLPGYAFAKISKNVEKTYNRDFTYFAELVLER